MLLMALPTDVQIEIIDHLTATLDHPMDNLCSLWVTYSSMRRICDDLTVSQCQGYNPEASQGID